MGYLIVNWVVSALGLLIVALSLPGFRVLEYESVLLATGSVGLFSALIASILRQVSSAPALVASGAVLVFFDTFLFRLSALLVPGFAMTGFLPALAGAAFLLALNLALLRLIRTRQESLHSPAVRP